MQLLDQRPRRAGTGGPTPRATGSPPCQAAAGAGRARARLRAESTGRTNGSAASTSTEGQCRPHTRTGRSWPSSCRSRATDRAAPVLPSLEVEHEGRAVRASASSSSRRPEPGSRRGGELPPVPEERQGSRGLQVTDLEAAPELVHVALDRRRHRARWPRAARRASSRPGERWRGWSWCRPGARVPPPLEAERDQRARGERAPPPRPRRGRSGCRWPRRPAVISHRQQDADDPQPHGRGGRDDGDARPAGPSRSAGSASRRTG